MLDANEESLLNVLRDSLLPGQDGIKIRAFLAFNRENGLVKIENLEKLKEKGVIEIVDDTIYPVEIL